MMGGFKMFFIDKLWGGEITPSQKAIRKGSDYHKLLHKITCAVSAFEEGLDENAKVRFREIEQAQAKLNGIENEETFIEGYRLGTGMILDVLNEYKGQLCQISEE